MDEPLIIPWPIVWVLGLILVIAAVTAGIWVYVANDGFRLQEECENSTELCAW